MSVSRRRFIKSSLAAGAFLSLGSASKLHGMDSEVERGGKRILILGGTMFLGPAIQQAALARGHHITLFTRGRVEDQRDLDFPKGVESLHGNRDPEKTADDWKPESERDPESPKGLSQLEGKKWDAVIDTSGYYPRIVRTSAELLAPNVKQYIFISSVSVYAGGATPNADESDPVGTMDDPTVESMGAQFENYGPLKALCEQAAEAAMPGCVANVRPGLIVGPGDPTDRFTYWPVRIAKGGEVLAPGSPDDPVQLIDVRDLAEWLVLMVEQHTTGVFNAINPAPGALTIGQTLDACKKAAKSDAMFTWASAEFLEKHGVSAWGDMPLWIPPEGEHAGFHLRKNEAAVKTGLKMRPVEVTASDILEWWPKEVERRTQAMARIKAEAVAAGRPEPQLPEPTKVNGGISPEREVEVLKAWHEAQQAG
jgi:2'-hydroxyisoflavone reductase